MLRDELVKAVLRHEAVGAFLTHCGWNSMLESVCAGVPMLCWPFAGDQQPNSRLACTECRVGVELGEEPRREEVATAIRQVMGGERGEQLRRSVAEWKEKAALAARPGGSSWANLEKLANEVLPSLIVIAAHKHWIRC
jgi:UDP:flavonoid glycosyltransferase YjiC (YdhE family)